MPVSLFPRMVHNAYVERVRAIMDERQERLAALKDAYPEAEAMSSWSELETRAQERPEHYSSHPGLSESLSLWFLVTSARTGM